MYEQEKNYLNPMPNFRFDWHIMQNNRANWNKKFTT